MCGCSVVWYLEPPLLTLVAVLGMAATAADYLVPALCQALFRPQDWSADSERFVTATHRRPGAITRRSQQMMMKSSCRLLL